MSAEIYVYAVSDILLEPSSALLFVSYHFDFCFIMAFPFNALHNVGGARSLARSSLRVLCNIVVGGGGEGRLCHTSNSISIYSRGPLFSFNLHVQS